MTLTIIVAVLYAARLIGDDHQHIYWIGPDNMLYRTFVARGVFRCTAHTRDQWLASMPQDAKLWEKNQ